ncbi:MAG: hypothetical protein ACOC2O_02645 [Bacillota bacterium]
MLMGVFASFFWSIFEATGSISAYLAYRDFFRIQREHDNII